MIAIRIAIAKLLFRIALLCYPRSFRRKFEDAMMDTFLEALEDARRAGRLQALRFVLRNIPNAAAMGVREHSRPSLPDMPSSRVGPVSRVPKMWMWTWPLDALREVRYALRSFSNRPGFTLLACSTVALGVGANTAILSVVNGVLLEPLPYPSSDRLVSVLTEWSGPNGSLSSLSYPDLVDIEHEAQSIDTLVGVSFSNMTLTGLGDPVVLQVTRVTKGLMESFRVTPKLGRDIRADEFGPNGPRVAVVSDAFWKAHFGGSDTVLGEKFFLDGTRYEVVGIAPKKFDYPTGAEIWIPHRFDVDGCGRGCHIMRGVGRLADSATLQEARSEVATLASSLRTTYPDTNTNEGFLIQSLKDRMVGDVSHGLLLLLGAVGLVVLIACANVANLLLVHASTRTGEVAIRIALGASRSRLIAQSLVESATLSLLGGALGVLTAAGAIALLPRFAASLPRLDNVSLDGRVLLMTLGLLVFVTFLFGSAPALVLSRESLRVGLAGTRGHGRQRFRNGLLALETALAAILLIGAGLLLKSFFALYAVDLGFEPRDLSRFDVMVPEVRYDSLEKIRIFFRDLEGRIAALPGVDSVGSVWSPPLARAHATGTVLVSGRPKPPPEEEREAFVHPMGPGFMQTMKMRILEGRFLSAGDDLGPQPVAIINETFAHTFFSGEDPIGHEVRVTVNMGYGSPNWRIVGVVADVRSRSLGDAPEPEIYVPHGLFGPESMTVTVRTRNGVSVLPAVREILHEMDPEVPIYRVETLAEVVDREVAPTRFYLVLLGIFASLAATLAAVGIYGVVAYAVASRTREIGLRLALGADRNGVVGLLLAQGMAPSALGLALGLAAAFAGAQVMQAVLFRVQPHDPWIFLSTAVLIGLVAFTATIVPARRASRIDPAGALRVD